MNETYISAILLIISILTVLTNLVTEVIKNCFTKGRFSSNCLALIVAEVLTICTYAAYVTKGIISGSWYMAVGAVLVGILVAYAAMFGFDKLKQALSQFGEEARNGN